MAIILVTGGSGFLGKALTLRLLKKGHKVYSLSRHPPAPAENLIPLRGDILEPNLGLEEVPEDIHYVHHLAANHKLGEDKDGSIWRTNVDGTVNVINFCIKRKISHLYFTSTAFTKGRNSYERSKALCEKLVQKSDIPRVTIFKPSVIMGTKEHFYPGHFSRFVQAVVRIHQRLEIVRKGIEDKLRLPPLDWPVLRIVGNPRGRLNLVTIDAVAEATANIEDTGTFWLTHPLPPTLKQLVDWVGEFIMVRMVIKQKFTPSAIEATFNKMASAFKPYLEGENLPSHLKDHPPITKEFIHDIIKQGIIAQA